MFRKSVVVVAAIALSTGLATSSASAARPQVAAKAGGSCTKVGALTTINQLKYVCVKNPTTAKMTWIKKAAVKKSGLSAECAGIQKANLQMKSDYDNALAKIADVQSKIAIVSGTAGDTLRAQVETLKSTILLLGPTVADAQVQFKLFCN